MTTESWHAVKQAANENRHELVLSGPSISKLIAETGLDKNLFNLHTLNYLHITQTCLNELPDEIANLQNLTTLVLHSNCISSIPKSIGKLSKLKILDCSTNKLVELPNELSNLEQLGTLNLASNLLRSIPSQVLNTKLTSVDLSNNKFETFPDLCYAELAHLAEIRVNGNQIKQIPAAINMLQSLKVLNIADNALEAIPGELADCSKLKDLCLKGNKLTDKRLYKLIDQCRTKQILDYVKQHCPKTTTTVVGNKSKKGKKNAQKSLENDDISCDLDAIMHKIKIFKVKDQPLAIKITEHVKKVRPYIAACVVKNLSFTDETFKKFIQMQTKLHDGVCEKRNAATIATHDLKLIPPGDLTYTAKPPTELEIKPLMRNEIYTGAALFEQLQTEADNLRKEKKRNVYSGIHKFLYLLEGKPLFPCLLDSKDQVISFPPITNSDITKMSVNTETMLVEVTSATSYQVCRNVLDQFIKELLMSGLSCPLDTKENHGFYNLNVEQVRIVDMEGNMKLIYPSRTDLNINDQTVSVLRE